MFVFGSTSGSALTALSERKSDFADFAVLITSSWWDLLSASICSAEKLLSLVFLQSPMHQWQWIW